MKRAASRLVLKARGSSVLTEQEDIEKEDAFRLFLGMRSNVVTQARLLGVSVRTLLRWRRSATLFYKKTRPD
jgi:transposase-like protein